MDPLGQLDGGKSADDPFTETEAQLDFLLDGTDDPKFAGVASARLAAKRAAGNGYDMAARDERHLGRLEAAAAATRKNAAAKKRAALTPLPPGALDGATPLPVVQQELLTRMQNGKEGPLIMTTNEEYWPKLEIPAALRSEWNLALNQVHEHIYINLIRQTPQNTMVNFVKYCG